jgi:phosphate transport system permease protein
VRELRGARLMATVPGTVTAADLRGASARRRREALIRGAFALAAGISIVISAVIVVSLIGNAISFLRQIQISSLFASGWFPRREMFSIATIFVGSLIVAAIAMAIAIPLGLGAAVYLSEYARPRARRSLKPVIELLAGLPSIVVGFFALTVISPDVVQRLFSSATFFNLFAAGIGVGILSTPLVATVSEDALRAVPRSLREGAYGLGARRRLTSTRIVVPAATSGIVASIILGLSRAIGETMVVLMVAGGTGGSQFTWDPLGPGQTATGAMAALAFGSDQVKGAGGAFQSLFFVGLLLFVVTFALNLISARFVRRARRHG